MNVFFTRSALAVMGDVLAAVLAPRTPITPVEWASANMVLPINAAEKLCQAGRVLARAAAGRWEDVGLTASNMPSLDNAMVTSLR
jgi:hypothetical protein